MVIWGGIGAHHPAAVAALLLERREFTNVVRRHMAVLRYEQATRTASPVSGQPDEPFDVWDVEREALVTLAAEAGVTRRELDAPRPRRDPQAASYCALCLAEYLPGFTRCATCATETVAYGEAPAARSIAR